jgi:pimeloyl-ACP methyl ester carboxylesterase
MGLSAMAVGGEAPMTSLTGLELDATISVALPLTGWGAPDAPRTALLLHGLTSAGAVWWRVADGLARSGFRVVAPDLRGHGSAPRTLGYPLGAFASDALRLRTDDGAWDLVVGHSLGGATAILALAADPSWARAALLVDPVIDGRAPSPEAGARFAAGAIAEVEEADAVRIQASHPDWHPEDVHLKVVAARQTSRHVVEAVLDGIGHDLEPRFESIAAPVVVLGADPRRSDAQVSAELGERLAARHPLLRYAVAEGSGHSIFRSDPERVVAEAIALVPME